MSASGTVKASATGADLVLLRADPLNCETPVSALFGGTVMPTARFYVRNHFPAPDLIGNLWRLHIGGLVKSPLLLSLRDLDRLPTKVQTVTLECAGNGRSSFTPATGGEQWGLGAVSTAEWTGVPLYEVMERVGVESGAREVLFRGADRSSGDPAGRFERSLTLEEVSESEVLLAYAMNGDPLPIQHGYPLRVIVPGWYGVASVKWLTEIEVIGHSFDGYFQTQKYLYEWERDGRITTEPVRQQRVRALISQPGAEEVVDVGTLAIRGLAWSGVAPIVRVEVGVNGEAWRPARLLGESSKYSWQRWELITRVDRPGRAKVRARATDMAGRQQPDHVEWNRLGYGNNAVQEISIRAK